MQPVLPDYKGACVSNVLSALLGDPPPWLPAPVVGADSIVLLVLDGLGWSEVERRSKQLPNLSALEGAAITTVLPATTASALTSITTGLAPAQHGITGFRMRVGECVLNVLGWHSDPEPPPDPHEVQRRPAFAGRPVPVVTKAAFRRSGFTRAHLDGGRFVGWQTPAVLVEHCRRLVGDGETLVFAYYPGVDEVAHACGIDDEFFARELLAADRLVGDLIAALPPRAALLVTSDHGQVALSDDSWVELDGVSELIDVQAGDARFRSVYTRPGARDDVVAALRDQLGDRAWVMTRRDVLDAGWLGESPGRAVGGRLGDVVLAASAPIGFVDPAVPFERRLRSAHGAPTEAEVLVPLLSARGTARTS